METIKEFIFTASPWGNSDAGWMVFATSPRFETGMVDQCRSWFRYRAPDGMSGNPTAEELEKYPLQYVVARPFGDERVLVSQTAFTGQRWYDPRPGDWLAHALVVPGDLPLDAGKGQSPFRWYRSPSLVTRYKEEWKEKARAINKRTIPWEEPPALPEPTSMDEIEANPDFSWNCLLGRISKDAWAKIGALIAACAKRGQGAKAMAFDAMMGASLDTMAAVLELLPVPMRAEAQFSTYFHADTVRETKADETFLFYGTIREGEQADADTGLYGKVPTGRLAFRGRREVEVFKQMVDACGEKLGAREWDVLVECWEVAVGRAENAEELRKAWTTASGFGVQEIVREVLERFARDGEKGEEGIVLAGWFEPELGLDVFENAAKNICAGHARDASKLAGALDGLKGDEAKLKFLKEVYEQAEAEELLPKLAEWWLVDGKKLKAGKLPHEWKDGVFGKFATLVEEYDDIRKGEAKGPAKELLKKVQDAKTKLGGGVQGMEETLRELEYKVELEEIKSWENLPEFAERAERMGMKGEKQKGRIKQDALKQVPLEKTVETINPEALERVANAYGMVGVGGEDVVAAIPGSRLIENPQAWVDALSKVRVDWKKEWASLAQRAIAAAREAGRKEGRNEAAGRGEGGRKGYRREEEERAPERERERSSAEIAKLETGAPVSVGRRGAGRVLAWLVACALAAAAGFGAGRWMNNGVVVEGDGVPKSEVEQMEQRWGERVERERIGRGQAQDDLRMERARADQLARELEESRRKEQEALERAARAESLQTGGATENPGAPARSAVSGRGGATGRTFQEKRMDGEPVGGGGRQGGTAYNKKPAWQAEGRKASGGDLDGWSVPAMVGEDEGKGAGGVPAAVGSGE